MMFDRIGEEITVGCNVAVFRPGGGAAIGRVKDIMGTAVSVQVRSEIDGQLNIRPGRLTEQVLPHYMLVLK